MTTVGAWLAAHLELERLDRELLVSRGAGLTRAQVLAQPERPLAAEVKTRLDQWALRRLAGVPMAYILGSREFWGLDFMVSPAVLVPRPETELLVEVALGLLRCLGERPKDVAGAGNRGRAAPTERADTSGAMASLSVLELGTGSGAAAVALACELTGVTITATDVSPEALAVAARNGASHRAAVTWLESDWFEQVHGRFDLIVSNPPYVAEDDPHLADLGHEPLGALVAGPDGLAAIRRIVAHAGDHLTTAGALALEHGCDQGAAVRALLESAGYLDVTTHRDLAGLERVTWGRGPESSP